MDQDNAVNAEVISDEEAEAAFNSGMNRVMGDRAPINEETQSKAVEAKAARESKAEEAGKEEKPVEKVEEEAKPDEESNTPPEATGQETEAEAEKEEPRFAGLKESEIKTLLAKAAEVDNLKDQIQKLHDRTAGKIGNLSQALKDLQSKPTARAAKIAKDQLKSLSKDFPELAERLAEDLSNIEFGGAAGAALVDPVEIEKRVEAKLAEIEFRADVKRLDTAHPDRKEIIASDAYRTWFALQPAEAQEMIRTSRSADFAIDAFNAFKSWRDRPNEPAPKQEEAAKAAKQRDKRLEDAMTPSGASADAGKKVLTPEEAFEAGLKKVTKQRKY